MLAKIDYTTRLEEKERTVVATLVAEFPAEPLSEVLQNLLSHAPESFSDQRLGLVAKAIHELLMDGKPIHAASAQDWLSTRGKLDAVGGANFVLSLGANAAPLAIAEYEAEAVWKEYRKRKVKSVLADALETAETKPDQIAAIADGVVTSLNDLARDGDSKSRRFTIRKPDEILGMQFDESDRILGEQLLMKGQCLTICGQGGTGKSRLLLQSAVACITSRKLVGFQTRGEGLRWLILQAENSNRRLQFDLSNLRNWVGEEDWRRVNAQLFIHTLETDNDGFLNLDDPDTFSRASNVVREFEPDIIGFDTLYNFGIGDLNKDQDMRDTLTAISRLIRQGNPERAGVVLHHATTGKAGAAKATGFDRASFGRNSKVLHAWTRAQINLAPGSREDNDVLVVGCGKSNDGRMFEPFAIRMNPKTMIYEVDPGFDLSAWESEVTGTRPATPRLTDEIVWQCCEGSMPKVKLVKALMGETGCGRSAAYDGIERAERSKRIHFTPTTKNYVRT